MIKMLIFTLLVYSYISYKFYSLYFPNFSPYIVIPIIMLILFSFIIFKSFEYGKGMVVPPQLMFISYMIMGIAVFLFIAFIAIDILALFKIKTILSIPIKYIALVIIAITCAYGYYNQLTPVLTTYDIRTDKKLEKDVKIMFISDLHIDDIMSDSNLEKYVNMINSIEADILLIGGDIIDKNIRDLTDSKKAILSKLNKLSYAVLGNHDYYSGDIDTVIREINDTGIVVLRDEMINFNNINIIGRDTRAHSFNGLTIDNVQPLANFNHINKDNYTIVIEHIPDRRSIKENKDFKSDMLLTGHTHGGQFFPITLIIKYVYENPYGVKFFDELATIVSSGIHLWGSRLRIGSVSEIVLINLSSK